MYYAYLLKSDRDRNFYIGYTSNLRMRFQQHLDGKVEATRFRRPLRLVYYESYCDEQRARDRELNLKQFGSAYTGLLKRLGYK